MQSKPIVHIYLIGPSGSGKTSIARSLSDVGYTWIPDFTTRPRRLGEDSSEHTFVTNSEYSKLDSDGLLLAPRDYRTAHEIWRYAYPARSTLPPDESTVEILDPINAYDISEVDDRRFVVLIDPPEEVLRLRLIQRGDDTNEIEHRLIDDRKSMRFIRQLLNVNPSFFALRIGKCRTLEEDRDRILERIHRKDFNARINKYGIPGLVGEKAR